MDDNNNQLMVNEQVMLKFNKTINELNNYLVDKTVIVACSTGVDSTVLLDLVLKVQNIKKVIVAHINHKKRLASDEEEAYIRTFCKERNITLYVKQLANEHKGNFQEWARSERYAFFDEIAKKEQVDYLLTAHHLQDNIETVIMRFIKGSSMEGYKGISAFTKNDNLTIYRPLINHTKDEIRKYCELNKLIYYEDCSNNTNDYTRNRIRHEIIPLMKEENNAFEKAFMSYIETINEANILFEEKINEFITNKVKSIDNHLEFNLIDLERISPFWQTQIVFRLLKPYKLSKKGIEEILKQCINGKDNFINEFDNNLLLIKEYGKIIIINKNLINKEIFLLIEKEGIYLIDNGLSKIKLKVNKNICYFETDKSNLCYNIQELPIIVRTRQNGDRIKTKVGTKSVSNFLTDRKVSHLDRLTQLVLCDKNSQVMYLLGLKYK